MRNVVYKDSRRLKTLTPSSKVMLFAVVLLLGTLVVAPFYLSRVQKTSDGQLAWGLITTHDLPNLVPMMEEFDKVLRSGVLYPRWNPDFNLGYGTATANFYPPASRFTRWREPSIAGPRAPRPHSFTQCFRTISWISTGGGRSPNSPDSHSCR